MKSKKRVIEIFDKKSGKLVHAIDDEDLKSSVDKAYMYDYVLAQIEVFTTIDEMLLGICTIEKN